MRRFSIVVWAYAIVLGILAQQAARADAIDDGPIRASPQRLILGSLAYGGPASTVLVREIKIEGLSSAGALKAIDFSHAPGVQILDRREDGETTILRFGINVAQFTSGEPYGIFIKRPIRLETTSPDQPQLIVSMAGWTALNETSRNFNDYLFVGRERWKGIWATPNIAGSVLAPLLLLLLGSAAALFPARNSHCWWLNASASIFIFGLFGALLALLAATYSRGAWTALLAGSILLILFDGRMRRFVLGSLLVFVLIIFLLPSGLKRVDSYAAVNQDPSIFHRLELWIGALQIMADYPRGIGAGQFSAVFEPDYQRVDHVAHNSTAVSDYLTVGTERGILFLSIIVGSLSFVLFCSLRAARARDNPWQLILSAALFAILVSSAFSTLWFVRDYQWLFALILTGLLICLLVQNWKDYRRKLASGFVQGGIFFCGSFIVLEIMALSSLFLQTTRSSDVSIIDRQGAMFSVHWIEPRWRKAKGIVIYFPGKQDSLPLLCHSTLRPLAALGWKVWIFRDTFDDNVDLASLIGSVQPHLPIFVAGQKEGGRVAWSTLAHLSKPIICAGAGLDFLTMDLDTSRGRASFHTPFLVFHFLYDDLVPANAAIRASRHTAFSGLPLTIRLSPDEPAAFSAGTAQWIDALNRYFSAQTTP